MSDLFLRPLFTWRSAVASPFGPENPTTRHVLLTLALHMNEKGESCFPSIDLLVEESGLSRRAVIQHLQVAAEAGWIGKRERPEKSGQGWRRIEYFPLIPQGIDEKVEDWDESRRARRALRSATDKGGDAGAPRRRGADGAPAKGGAAGAEGGARSDQKVVHDVHPSTSVSTSNREPAAARRSRLPADFKASEVVQKWYGEKGYPKGLLPLHLETFIRKVEANGSKYVDWDKALMNAVADDWGDVRRNWLRLNPGSAAATHPTSEWWKSVDGVASMGLKLGVERKDMVPKPGQRDFVPGEQNLWFKARVCAAAGEGPWCHDKDPVFQQWLKVARERMQVAA